MAEHGSSRAGLWFALTAYGLWGMMPLYFRAVSQISPKELLTHRIVWSVAFLAIILTLTRRWESLFHSLGNARTRLILGLSTILIAINWFVFIYGVAIGQIVQNSLGYFINPLFNILIGVFFFRERLRPVQWIGLGLASCGLIYLILSMGKVPWIAIILASSFAGYGVIRKIAPVDSLVGLTVETLYLLPFSALLLLWWGRQGLLGFMTHGWLVDLGLIASGVVTAVPLLCFGAAARRLPLSTLGFIQYLSPTLQFLLAVLYFGEPFQHAQKVCFGLIWTALLLVTLDSLRKRNPVPRLPKIEPSDPPASKPS